MINTQIIECIKHNIVFRRYLTVIRHGKVVISVLALYFLCATGGWRGYWVSDWIYLNTPPISIPTHSVTFASPETFKEYFFRIPNSWFYAFTLKTASSYCAEWKGWCWIIYTRDLKTLRTLYFVSSSCDFRTTVEGMERELGEGKRKREREICERTWRSWHHNQHKLSCAFNEQ